MRTRSKQAQWQRMKKAGLGQGARKRYPHRRSQVARTMGPFAATESKYFTSTVSARAFPESQTWVDTEIDPTTFNTLCLPVEGADISQRIGRKISVYKIAIRGTIQQTNASDQPDVLANPAFRLILYIDQQTNGVQSQGEEVMAAPGGAATVLTAFNSFQNLANLGRFRILRDKIYRGTVQTAGTDGASTVSINSNHIPFKMTVRFRNPVIIRFNATNGGTIGDIVDNSFHLIGNKSGTSYDHTINYQCRAYYKDA